MQTVDAARKLLVFNLEWESMAVWKILLEIERILLEELRTGARRG